MTQKIIWDIKDAKIKKPLQITLFGLTFFLLVCDVCTIWYYLYNLKHVKNTHRVLLLVKLQATVLKVTFLHGCFSRFLDCTNVSTWSKTSHTLSSFRHFKVFLTAFLAVPRPTLGHFRRDNLINPMFIILFSISIRRSPGAS